MCGEAWYRAILAAIWTETMLYGIYTLLFAEYVYIYLTSDEKRGANKTMVFTAIAMFALSTALMFNDFIRFLLTPDSTVNTECIGEECGWCQGVSDNIWEDDVYNVVNIIYLVLFTTNQFIADTLLTYRCYVVWQNMRMIVVLPALMVLATTVIGYVQTHIAVLIYLFRRDISPTVTIIPKGWLQLDSLGSSLNYVTSGLALATNLLVTGLIAFRVWWVTRELESSLGKPAGRRYRAAIAILIESGAIYSAAQVIQLIMTYKSPQSYDLIVTGAINQLVGIVPTMIMVRVALSRSSSQGSMRESNVLEFVSPMSERVLSQPMVFASASIAQDDEARESVIDVSRKARRRSTISVGMDRASIRSDGRSPSAYDFSRSV